MTDSEVRALHIGFPRNFIALSRGFTSSHRGVDMCWNDDYGGAYAPVYAPADGEVVALDDGWGNTWAYDKSNWGNYIKIKHATGVYTLMAHLLKGSLKVSIGDKVKRGQTIATMNSSGASTGNHVHFELYLNGSGTSYRVDPLKYCYAYPTDYVGDEHYFSGEAYTIMRYTPIARVGTPVARNTKVNQAEVTATTLRARKSPSLKGDILGYANRGVYNCVGFTDADGYRWYGVEDFWVAQAPDGDWVNYYPAKVQQYDLTMHKLSPQQKDTMVAWCEAEGVSFDVKEV